ncbi:Glutamate decarboxylase [Nakaseomyces bracarensis]|uniref:Glutamate decarboxylase n=1 Tax=Nakaseomyces bracarensis TaxID=273131 RepID=A0ABR4NQ23_9SACH
MLHKHTDKQRQPISIVKHQHIDAGLEDFKLLSQELQEIARNSDKLKSLGQSENKESHLLSMRYSIPDQGIPAALAYELIHNELTLDGNPHLNLASFVNTTTTHESRKLMTENITKNLADNDEYPQLIELTQRCISMIASMWKANEDEEPMGCATTGSSEAIMLGGLAMKKMWERKMKEAGKTDVSKPNIIMSSACQVALEKFARYFDVECRLVPVSAKSQHMLDPNLLWDFVDENTIGCFVIMGTTYTGHLENVSEVADVLTEIEKQHPDWANKEIPIHVDGASGGFIVPFAFTNEQMKEYGNEHWAFDHPRVVSINTSGHKFGLVTPGLGWVLWRDESLLAPELRFRLKYLGGVEETFGLNFSRPGFQVVHQYYNFSTLGFKGFHDTFNKALFVSRVFAHHLLKSPIFDGSFEVVSSIHKKISDGSIPDASNAYWEHPEQYVPGVPLIAFKFSDKFRKEFSLVPQALLSHMLRTRGWIIPNYPLPHSTDDSDKQEVLRVVFRTEMTLDLAQLLLADIQGVLKKLKASYIGLKDIAHEVDAEKRRDYVYKMLLTIASPDEPEDEPEDETAKKEKQEKKQHIKQRLCRNYRGTC